MNKAKTRDVAFGEHSLIPGCCIKFYVTEWEREYTLKTPYFEAVHSSKWAGEYVPCPLCLGTGNVVKIRRCATDCGKDCSREF